MKECKLKMTVNTDKAMRELRRIYAGTRQFYARPCDEPRKGWCVAEDTNNTAHETQRILWWLEAI